MTSTPADSTAPAIDSRPAQRGRLGRLIDADDERMGIKALEFPVPEHANGVAGTGLVLLAATTEAARILVRLDGRRPGRRPWRRGGLGVDR